MAHLWMIYLLINTTVTTVNVLILDLRKRSPPPNIFNTFIFLPKIPKEWISHWKNPKPSTRKQIPDGIIFPLKHQRNNYSLQPKCPFLVEFHGFSSFSCVLFPEGRLYPPPPAAAPLYAACSPEALSPLLLCHSRCHMTPRKPKLFLGSVHQQQAAPKL